MQRKRTVVVFGDSKGKPGEALYDSARALGAAIAEEGWVICNGGYGGTMEAGCRGAVEASGDKAETIGVTCKAFGRRGVSSWVRNEIHTDNLNQRLTKLVELGDGYVVLIGSTGTLLELACVWEMMNKKFIPKRPIVLLGDYWKPLIDTIGARFPEAARFIDRAENPSQVMAILRERLSGSEPSP